MKTLIADSGSTKTDWALLVGHDTIRTTTSGINPVHMPAEEIETLLKREFQLPRTAVSALCFYGSGCIPSKCGGVATVLSRFFDADQVTVESDLVGAARGLLGDDPGIACILGTGSNSALYDGRQIQKNIRPLGYILGDEGSGTDLGKRLLGSLLKGLLPPDLTAAFYREYAVEYPDIIESVYRKPGANRFLAQFGPFLSRHIDHPSVRDLVETALTAFTERNLLPYEGVRNLPVSFTGSVAFYFEKQLRAVLHRSGLTVGKIERSPMEGLIRYHRSVRRCGN